jgi:dTDP-glucose pyrophosphorylase
MDLSEKIQISPDTKIIEALKVMDLVAHKSVIIVNADKTLLGVASDGDIRRWILKNGSLEQPISAVMNTNPITLQPGYTKDVASRIMTEKMIEVLPVIDDNRRIVDVCFWNNLFIGDSLPKTTINMPVVIMAGGVGTRLHPYTKILPKPLIPIGDKPIIQHIIERFHQYGCNKFYLTLNYKAGMIKSYFNELEKDYSIEYIEESIPSGTGGSLHLLKDLINTRFFVSNCDILIDADYADILSSHQKQGNCITMVASIKNYTIPYGVISLNESEKVNKITEKPELTWLVNTGLYILDPQAIDDIPKKCFYNITDLINKYLSAGKPVGVYPITEKSWMDMGQLEEMQEMMKRMGVS